MVSVCDSQLTVIQGLAARYSLVTVVTTIVPVIAYCAIGNTETVSALEITISTI